MSLDFSYHELFVIGWFVYHELASLAHELTNFFIIAFYLPFQNNQLNIFAATCCSKYFLVFHRHACEHMIVGTKLVTFYLHDGEAEPQEVALASLLYIMVVWVSIPSFHLVLSVIMDIYSCNRHAGSGFTHGCCTIYLALGHGTSNNWLLYVFSSPSMFRIAQATMFTLYCPTNDELIHS
jgi:hypothetical protein